MGIYFKIYFLKDEDFDKLVNGLYYAWNNIDNEYLALYTGK